ncbi:alpha/beta hydrolase [Kribbella sp. NPDC026611]|uniref:RBBP9/YdeN family alpha/beta hydrolase n=1 Tax=Kribbella sp. NPDC026611 TaxID=3154911 RepID=UPI0033EF523E
MIVVPGLGGSGPDHWQSYWLREDPDGVRVEQRDWDQPRRDEWVPALDAAARRATGPVILVAHSLGCHTVAHWATQYDDVPVRAALLVAPPDVDHSVAQGAPIADFGLIPTIALPFPTVLAASSNDPWAELAWSRLLAKRWGARFVDLGNAGHVNAEAGFGPWPEGKKLLQDLTNTANQPPQP